MNKLSKMQIVLSIITAINVLVATGYSMAGMICPSSMLPLDTETGEGAFIFALYAGARTLPLAIISIYVIIARKWNYLVILAILAGTIQFIDGFIGIYQHDLMKSAGPFFLAIIQYIAVWWYLNKENITKKEKAHK